MTSETEAEFVEIMMEDGDWQPGSRMHRLALLARRGADAADRIAQLEAEGDKARARGDALRMALEDIAYPNPLHNEDDLMRIARTILEERT